jgi:hypothetical protein
MAAFPYADVYLGYVMIYHAQSDRTVDLELAWSPDSIQWERVAPGKPLVPRGPEGSYDSKCIYGPAGPAIVQDGKLLIYYGGSQQPHRGWKRHCLPCLARLRQDGFAGYEPSTPGVRGTVTTVSMAATGEPLRVSADARGGSLRVAVLDVPGYGLDDCEPITDDVTDGVVRWKGGKDLTALRGKPVRLMFELKGSRLWAFGGLEGLRGELHPKK